MISKNYIEDDLELRKYISLSEEEKPRFNWGGIPQLKSINLPESKYFVKNGDKISPIDIQRLAETIGKAITDLELSRNQENIFSDSNQNLITNILSSISVDIQSRFDKSESNLESYIDSKDFTSIIETALIKQNAHDVAKSLLIGDNKSFDLEIDEIDDFSVRDNDISCRVIRRNGEVVSWIPSKIEIAVRSAFLSLEMNSSPAKDIADKISNQMTSSGRKFIHIEDLQDKVQEELMKQGHYKVAEAYILYRSHQTKLRNEKEDKNVVIDNDSITQDSLIVIIGENNNSYLWDGLDLKKRIDFAYTGLDLCLSKEEIEIELRRAFFNEMTKSDLRKTIILNARSLIEKDGDFTKFAARILLSYIYEEVLSWDIVKDGITTLKEFHRKAFKNNILHGIEINRFSKDLQEYNLDKISNAIDPILDLDLDYLGVQTLYDRYLIIDKTSKTHKRIETPQNFWMRVSMGIMVKELDNKEDKAIELYNLYSHRRFSSSTPTLFNSGTLHSQLSSCYLYKIDDTIESIMERGISENAYLSKWSGGLGGSWTSVRGIGSYIKGTNGESQGVIPFLKLHNDLLVAVNQGGKRRGSGCAYLEIWHNDILDFLELRKNTGDERRRTHDMNTANWIPDLFMKRMEARENWTLFRSNEVPDLHEIYGKEFENRYIEYEFKFKNGQIYGKEIAAIDLWRQMLKMIFETGHPWITFKDPCNIRNPQDHTGVIHSSNLCTEITLNTSKDETAVCNLGSIVLENHLKEDGSIDLIKLRETVKIAIRALDNVIDINFYPTQAAKTSNMRHRPIGLGVMGLQNSLFIKNIPFSSQLAIDFNDEFMEAISYFAYEASSDLALERGAYSSFEGSKWSKGILPFDTINILEQERGQEIEVNRESKMDWNNLREKIRNQGMRNSNVIAIAPTATISNIMGSSPCIEPTFKNLFVKGNLSGDFISLNKYLVKDLKKLNLWNDDMLNRLKYYDGELNDIHEIPNDIKEKYLTAFSIDYKWIIDAASRRQKWIDQSQSLNLFLPTPDMKLLSHMYRSAWRKGLKTTYYLRTQQASNIEKATTNISKKVNITSNEENFSKEKSPEQCSIDALLNGEECESCQ